MKNIKTDFLIVGSGLYGCVIAERIANILKKKVIIIEKRNHIGGNCYSEIDKQTGIEFHKYGTHIFHTSKKNVWNYLKNFTSLNNYKHQVLSNYKSKIYQMPINLETINKFFNKKLDPSRAELFLKNKAKKFIKKNPNNFEEKALMQIGKDLYKAFIKGYTEKQWGKSPKKLPSSIFNRLPIRFDYNKTYFKNADIEGIPSDGYTKVFERLTSNSLINIIYNKSFNLKQKYIVKKAIIYTGPLDKLLNYKFGKLEWRSVKFKKKILNKKDYQGTSVINYPEKKIKFTRIHEPRHLHSDRNYKDKTLIIKEFPEFNSDEPYYPINDKKNRLIHSRYINYLNKNYKNFITGGRLADYAYYDMDMTIAAALKKFEFIKKNFK
tara:strand:+ start:82 stop:1218 length:1137 start_codon:yes stop_codon:yes gene_type:complete